MPSLAETLDLLHLFGDATRVRLAVLLARHELTVAELTEVTELAQSRVSTHLGKLREAGVLRDRRQGASTFYALNDGAMPDDVRRVWTVVEGEVDDEMLRSDAARADRLVRARDGAATWPDSVAGQMERHYSPGRTWEAMARGFLGLIRLGDVLDGGSGDGSVAQLLAPRARSLTCLDRSRRVLDAARARLAGTPNVRFAHGALESMPLGAASFDQVLLFHVLASTREPAKVLAETARVLRPGGNLALVTLNAHRHLDTTAPYGHLQPGYAPAALRGLLEGAGLVVDACEVVARERRPPNFEVVTAFARKETA